MELSEFLERKLTTGLLSAMVESISELRWSKKEIERSSWVFRRTQDGAPSCNLGPEWR